VYPVILDPPLLGSLQARATSPSPAVADAITGADGSECGTVVDEATVVDVVEDVVGVVEGVKVVPVGGK
jgi:hypothetical protein